MKLITPKGYWTLIKALYQIIKKNDNAQLTLMVIALVITVFMIIVLYASYIIL